MKTDTNPIILDGKALSEKLYEGLKLIEQNKKDMCKLIILTVGEDPASKVYVRNKLKACKRVGIDTEHIIVDENMDDCDFEDLILKLLSTNIYDVNSRYYNVGIILQLPVPNKMFEHVFNECIPPLVDVDGFGERNKLLLYTKDSEPYNYPATPKGIITLLNNYNIPIEGKHVVIVGRSEIVGRPLAQMLLDKNATVTICHSKTENLAEITKTADILVAAIGKPKFIKAEHIKAGVTVVDVGINRTDEGLCGDVDFDCVKDKCYAITPVPGGVGPMTVYSLIENVISSTVSI